MRRMLKDPAAVLGLILALVVVVAGLAAPLLAPASPYVQDLESRLSPPGEETLLGSDQFGRDITSRILWGARISLKVGVMASVISLLIGSLLGLLAGYFGGWLDSLIMRFTDVIMGFPALLFMIAIMAAVEPSLEAAMVAIGLVSWPSMARLMRSTVLTVRHQDYILAARALGLPHRAIILRHVLPNCLSPVIVAFSMGIAGAIMAEASLSFLGLGAQPPEPSWGSMINDGKDYLRVAPWLSLAPGGAIALAVLGFNLLGEGLRDALDPKYQRTS